MTDRDTHLLMKSINATLKNIDRSLVRLVTAVEALSEQAVVTEEDALAHLTEALEKVDMGAPVTPAETPTSAETDKIEDMPLKDWLRLREEGKIT